MKVTEDALAANAPHIRLLGKHNVRYIIVIKPEPLDSIFEAVYRCLLIPVIVIEKVAHCD